MANTQFVRNGHVGLVQAIAAIVSSTDETINGTPYDRQDFPEEFHDALVVANVGALAGGGSVSVTVTVQESDSESSGYTQVTDTDNGIDEASMVFTGAGIKYRSVKIKNLKRFMRPSAAIDFTGGSSPSIPIAVEIIAINPRWSPSEDN